MKQCRIVVRKNLGKKGMVEANHHTSDVTKYI